MKEAIVYTMNTGNYDVSDPNTVYYFDYRLGELEKGGEKSPFGSDWMGAYLIVTNDGSGNLTYYWTSVDGDGMRIDPKKELIDIT